MTVPALTDGVVVLDAFLQADVSAHVAGEDEEHARRFGWWPKSSTEEGVRDTIARWEREWGLNGRARAFAVRVEGVLAGGCELRLREDANAGYREEGVLRARRTIAGRRRDMVLYARVRGDGAA